MLPALFFPIYNQCYIIDLKDVELYQMLKKLEQKKLTCI